MTDKTSIIEQAKHYISVKENYPACLGKMKYISQVGWATEKEAHPCELTTCIIDEVFEKGNLLQISERECDIFWNRIAYIQRGVVYNFVKERLNISETKVNKLLFDHGIKLVNSQHGAASAKWLASMRFGKVLDHYAVSGIDSQKDRIMSKLQIMVKETGCKWEDFIL